MSKYELLVMYFCIYLKTWNKVYNWMCTATFDVNSYRPCNVKFFMTKPFSLHSLRLY